MLAALASFGGLGQAASGVSHAVRSAVHVVSPAQKAARPDGALSSAAAQYIVAMCIQGNTIYVDDNAVFGLTQAGATRGPCVGTSAPRGSRKLVFVCFRKHSIKVQQRSVPAMRKLGAKKGKCKK